jgi:hypothetical protein
VDLELAASGSLDGILRRSFFNRPKGTGTKAISIVPINYYSLLEM